MSRFTGVRIVIRGNGEEYYLHIRSGDTRLPWQFYAAPFGTTGQWTQVDVPFAAFRPAALSKPLDARHLSRIAIVAANKAIDADVAVARVSFYG